MAIDLSEYLVGVDDLANNTVKYTHEMMLTIYRPKTLPTLFQ